MIGFLIRYGLPEMSRENNRGEPGENTNTWILNMEAREVAAGPCLFIQVTTFQ
jgi:hypothetical protein